MQQIGYENANIMHQEAVTDAGVDYQVYRAATTPVSDDELPSLPSALQEDMEEPERYEVLSATIDKSMSNHEKLKVFPSTLLTVREDFKKILLLARVISMMARVDSP